MVPEVYALVLTAVVVVVLSIYASTRRSGKRAPYEGTLFHQLLHFKRYHDYLTDITRRHKTFRLMGPTHDEIFTADPRNVEYILAANFANYGKGQEIHDVASDLFGDGIFVVDGKMWRHQRKLASYEFSTKVLRDFSSVIFKKNAVKLAQIVLEAANSGKVMDIQDLFMKSTMDSIFKISFGVELNCLGGQNQEGTRFTKAFDDSSELMMWRFINPLWKLARLLNIGSEAALKKNIKLMNDFVYELISRKIMEKDKADSVERQDILSRFLLQSESDPETMNHKYLRDIILNFVIAGKDTSAVTLSWFFYMLCKHPNVQRKVTEEVIVATQSSYCTTFEEFTTTITEEAISKMQYLQATLSETLRLYPAVPSDSKTCFSDDVLPDGFRVRKGDMVTYQPYPMGRMKFLWGEDAEIFRPDRWLDEYGQFQSESPFKFPAFQAGPRVCIGKEFAYRQMRIFAAVLLRFFTFKLDDENKKVTYRTMLTLQIDEGLRLRASVNKAK